MHEMPKPIFCKKIRKNIFSLSSADQTVVKVKDDESCFFFFFFFFFFIFRIKDVLMTKMVKATYKDFCWFKSYMCSKL